MERLLDVLLVVSICLLFIVMRGIRRSRIRIEYSVSWLAAVALIIALSRSKGLLVRISGLLGVDEPLLVLIFLIMLVFVGVFQRFSIVISHLKDMNITLTQRVAILEFELRRTHGITENITKD
jgi:hypothetical protein